MADAEDTYRIAPAGPRPATSGAEVTLPPGTLAGEYVLRAVIASGGHGTVYEAEHRILGRRAAVKVLHPHLATQGQMLQRFVREARVVNQIRHPNIVDIYDFGLLGDGSPFCVMELLSGRSLSQLLQERGRVSPATALAFLEPVCTALDAAHRAGVVHRDLKASNIAVLAEGEQPRIKLLDFGIAKLIHPEPTEAGLTTAGQRLGTAYAMAPEQIRGGPIDVRTDIYALGVMLFQLPTGDYPFRAPDRLEVERMHLEATPPRPSDSAPVSPALDAVVLRCLEKLPERRFPDVSAFLAALREAVGPAAGGDALAPERWETRAMGLWVEVELGESAGDEETVFEQVGQLMDEAESALRQAGFQLGLQTGTALLGVKPLPEDSTQAARDRRAALAAAEALHARTQAACSLPALRARLCLHEDAVALRRTSGSLEVLGGPLAEVSRWVVHQPSGLAVSPALAREVEQGARE